jgi:Flp pilus assembly protein TadG
MNRTTRRRSQWQQPRSQAPGRRFSFSRDESGGVAVTTAICLVFLIGFVALVLDVGHLQAVRNEVQNAADSAALAGCRALFPYQGYPDTNLIPITEPPYCSLAFTTAKAAATENHPGGIVDLAFAPGDVETGIWDWTNRTFTAQASCAMNINAVRVTIRKDAEANQPVATWFASIIGIDTVNVNAQAVAAVGFVNGHAPGDFWHIAVQKSWLDQQINKYYPGAYPLVPAPPGSEAPPIEYAYMNPDQVDNGGFCAPADTNVNAQYLVDAINGGSSASSSEAKVSLVNGLMGSVHMALDRKIATSTWTDAFGVTQPGWLVYLPIVSVNQFNQSTDLVQSQVPDYTDEGNGYGLSDYVPIVLTDVLKPSEKGNPLGSAWAIQFYIYHGPRLFDVGGPSGPGPGVVMATIPRLVQ